ncbi:hypothetical protein LTS15_004968 [Exophiala xenobiotica]|nr:hypothetical protein LTS15_004968 [Exophiala xenobiotica]
MVRLSDVKIANADFIASLNEPLVGVFVGGTSGICEYALRALISNAASVGKSKSKNIDLRIYIVGRNAKAADVTIADCRKLYFKPTSPSSKRKTWPSWKMSTGSARRSSIGDSRKRTGEQA